MEKRVENYNERALLVCLNEKSRGNFLLCVPRDLKCHLMFLKTKKGTLVPVIRNSSLKQHSKLSPRKLCAATVLLFNLIHILHCQLSGRKHRCVQRLRKETRLKSRINRPISLPTNLFRVLQSILYLL
jgi:hypothetical protein